MKNAVLYLLFLIIFHQATTQSKIPLATGLEVENPKYIPIFVNEIIGTEQIGLTKDMVQTRCELVLRKYGITSKDTLNNVLIAVNIGVTGRAFGVEIDFIRPMNYVVAGKWYMCADCKTWIGTTYGIVPEPDGKTFVLDNLETNLEDFVNKFQKANEK
jgi:hypothetical protein